MKVGDLVRVKGTLELIGLIVDHEPEDKFYKVLFKGNLVGTMNIPEGLLEVFSSAPLSPSPNISI